MSESNANEPREGVIKKSECLIDESKRNFLKFGGVAAAGLTIGGLGIAGQQLGHSDKAYIGVSDYTGNEQFFDRKPFEVDVAPGFKPVSTVERPHWTAYFIDRISVAATIIAQGKWNPGMGLETLPGPVGDFYRKNPERYKTFLKIFETIPKQAKIYLEKKDPRYAIADAYVWSSMSTMYPDLDEIWGEMTVPQNPVTSPDSTPDKWDFRFIRRKQPLEFKSPKHASELLKLVAHKFGATLVGICKFDPTFTFSNYMRGITDEWSDGVGNHPGVKYRKGREVWGTEVPGHWKSMIVYGVPMHWDPLLSAQGYSTSYDAYSRAASIATKLERFIQELGYPSRPQNPPTNYEAVMPPYAVLAGLGEIGRMGLVVTPELGANIRLAGVITNIEFEYDKPIDFGLMRFCKKCKICADHCPAGALPKSDEPDTELRGFEKWEVEGEKCFLQWASGPLRMPHGCRVCVGVCPYTRKNTWLHTISRAVDARDPTGVISSGLLAMQKGFFYIPDAEDFKSDWDGGKEATYHNPPKWMRTEEYFKINKDWTYYGND